MGSEAVRAHVFVDDVEEPVLDGTDRHHLERVLRLRDGDVITVGDGRGGVRPCRLGPELEPIGPVVRTPAPVPALTVAFALTKGDRPELVVQKLTEVGVDTIVPFVAARTVVRWDGDKAARQGERLRRVAREAAMQSRRAHLPDVADLTDFAAVATREGASLAAPGGDPPSLGRPCVLVGPEGGWDPEELVAGLPRTGLGPHVLRAETAAIAAGVLLVALRHGIAAAKCAEPG